MHTEYLKAREFELTTGRRYRAQYQMRLVQNAERNPNAYILFIHFNEKLKVSVTVIRTEAGSLAVSMEQ